MKNTFTFIVGFLMFVSCSVKQTDNHEKSEVSEAQDEWQEMDTFHMIMAESFHPYADSANIAPAKANAKEMARLAEEWLKASLPGKVNNEDVKGKLHQLSEEATHFASLAESTDDEKIGASLNKLHDLFHEIQDVWYTQPPGEGHHHTH